MNGADLVFLCLPDAAAKKRPSRSLKPGREGDRRLHCPSVAPTGTTASELSAAHRAAICRSRRVANPGCHATGFISSVYPLVQAGLIAPDEFLTCFSLTGYSGGGKKMIAQYEGAEKPAAFPLPGSTV